MQLTVTTGSGDIYTIDVSDDLELENFKALLEFECGVPATDITVYHDGKLLEGDKKTVGSFGVKNGDVLLMVRSTSQQRPQSKSQPVARQSPGVAPNSASGNSSGLPAINWGAVQIPQSGSQPNSARPQSAQRPTQAMNQRNSEDPASIRELFLSNPHQLALLKERNPRLADALLSGNLEEFAKILAEQRKEHMERVAGRMRMFSGDPFDPEIQRQISEEIRMENINSNMETAMEYQPESFGQVFMLYINCSVNGHHVKAFVDSGAQMTIMSSKCAERCGVTRLIDHRWAGTAIGVGTQKILGRIHMCQMQIEKDFFPTSFSVLEDQHMDILLGLDMLKRHQCVIDLKSNILQIGTTGTETSFLAEADLPASARLNQRDSTSGDKSAAEPMQEEEDRMLAEALAKSAEEASKSNTSMTPELLMGEEKFGLGLVSLKLSLPNVLYSKNGLMDIAECLINFSSKFLCAIIAIEIQLLKESVLSQPDKVGGLRDHQMLRWTFSQDQHTRRRLFKFDSEIILLLRQSSLHRGRSQLNFLSLTKKGWRFEFS